MISRVVPLLFLCACGGQSTAAPTQSATATASSRPAGSAIPTLHDLRVSDVPLSALHPEAETLWRDAAQIRADRLPTTPTRDEVEHRQFVADVFQPWVTRRRARTEALRVRLAPLAEAPDARLRLFASIVMASVEEDTVMSVRVLPPPESIARLELAVVEFRAALDRMLGSYAAQSRDLWHACVTHARSAPEWAHAWVPVCLTHESDMALIAAASSQTQDGAPPRSREPAEVPAECRTAEEWPSIEAPVPNLRARPEIAVVDGDYTEPAFSAAERARLLDVVTASLPRAVRGRRVIPRAETRRAETLHAERRLSPGTPACGQAPPLPAILAQRHRHLLLADVVPLCVFSADGDGRHCLLQIVFRRAGSTERSGLPEDLSIDVPGGETGAIDPWLRAAATLGRAPRSRMGLFAMLTGRGEGGTARYVVRGAGDDDPWLRVGFTLSDAREAMTACLVGRGVASLSVRFTISPTGDAGEVQIEPRTVDAIEHPEQLTRCIADAVDALAFPCTPNGRPAAIEVLLCVAR